MPNNTTFKGGIYIANLHPVSSLVITKLPPPDKVILLLQQRVGGKAETCVSVGDHVLTGQIVARGYGFYCMPMHASISGIVTAIDKQPIAHPSGINGMCITIESDGKDTWVEKEKYGADFLNKSPEDIIEKIHESGIVGMGGGGFPTHAKIQMMSGVGIKTLIVNAAECEPGIMCDDALMQTYPQKIIRGVEILLYACGAKSAIIAIEDDKKDAFNALAKHNHNKNISIEKVVTKYTSGVEKLLIKTLLGIEVASGAFVIDSGILCQNIGTIKAIYDAIVDGIPLISRVVTITGSGVTEPRNYEARLGASFEDIIVKSKPNKQLHSIRMGGMMMGVDVANAKYSVCKITNCIFVNNKVEEPVAQECIRCGECNTVCPVGLLPQQLYWYAKNKDIKKAFAYNLADCISCACCDYVCPSNIKLTQYFSFARAINRQQIAGKRKADIAKKRFEYREFRLERNKEERATMLVEKKLILQQKMANNASQKEFIAQAIKRAEQKKA